MPTANPHNDSWVDRMTGGWETLQDGMAGRDDVNRVRDGYERNGPSWDPDAMDELEDAATAMAGPGEYSDDWTEDMGPEGDNPGKGPHGMPPTTPEDEEISAMGEPGQEQLPPHMKQPGAVGGPDEEETAIQAFLMAMGGKEPDPHAADDDDPDKAVKAMDDEDDEDAVKAAAPGAPGDDPEKKNTPPANKAPMPPISRRAAALLRRVLGRNVRNPAAVRRAMTIFGCPEARSRMALAVHIVKNTTANYRTARGLLATAPRGDGQPKARSQPRQQPAARRPVPGGPSAADVAARKAQLKATAQAVRKRRAGRR